MFPKYLRANHLRLPTESLDSSRLSGHCQELGKDLCEKHDAASARTYALMVRVQDERVRNLIARFWNFAHQSKDAYSNDPTRFDLRLMSLENAGDIPNKHIDMFIIANVRGVLHFYIFDADGQVVVNEDENSLLLKAQHRPADVLRSDIAGLREQLNSGNLWPPHGLTRKEKNQVIGAVTTIVGYDHLTAMVDAMDTAIDQANNRIGEVLRDLHTDGG